MVESLHIDSTQTKEEKYAALIPQIRSLIEDEPNMIANLANIAAALKSVFDHLWIGFYQIDSNELVLGPFQGPIACTRITFGKGVCGTAWKNKETIIVDDVNSFPGHIACSSDSKSEIVVPIVVNDQVAYVLDIDSDEVDQFDFVDKKYLETLGGLIAAKLDKRS